MSDYSVSQSSNAPTGGSQIKFSVYLPKMMLAIAQHAWLVIMCLIVLVPVVWMVFASFTPGKILKEVPVIPDFSALDLSHYKYLFTYSSTGEHNLQNADFIHAFLRTLTIAILNTLGTVILHTLMGYVFSRFRFAGKKGILLLMLILQMFPAFMGMVALFLIFRTFGWINQYPYLTLIYLTTGVPINTYLVRGFMNNIPMSFDEAARIDGASKTKISFTIILPLSLPIIGFIGINAFIAPWMDYILANFMLTQKSQTVAIFLFRLTDPMITMYYNPLNFMAGGPILAIPITLIMLFGQRFFVYGLTAGGDKG